jgi:TatD DNase family protein
MIFADTHTHLYLEEFDNDREKTVDKAIDNDVNYLFLPNIDSGSVKGMMDLCGLFPGNCFPMMGLHPTSVKSDYREEFENIEKLLSFSEKKFYAIGEIGIDLYWSRQFESEQLSAFGFQLDLAVKHDLPVVIHTRNSFDVAAGIIEKRNDPSIRGIFHCFGGSVKQAEKAISLGFLLGIGGIITYKNSGLQKVVEVTGLEHLVLETDSPFLPPVPFRGQRNESSYIPLIAQKIAEIKNVTIEEVAAVTTENAVKLFNMKIT